MNSVSPEGQEDNCEQMMLLGVRGGVGWGGVGVGHQPLYTGYRRALNWAQRSI